jgi:hypothetical protein
MIPIKITADNLFRYIPNVLSKSEKKKQHYKCSFVINITSWSFFKANFISSKFTFFGDFLVETSSLDFEEEEPPKLLVPGERIQCPDKPEVHSTVEIAYKGSMFFPVAKVTDCPTFEVAENYNILPGNFYRKMDPQWGFCPNEAGKYETEC